MTLFIIREQKPKHEWFLQYIDKATANFLIVDPSWSIYVIRVDTKDHLKILLLNKHEKNAVDLFTFKTDKGRNM